MSDSAATRRYFGKYRGVVLNNIDPDRMGRIMPEVPSVPGMLLNWAMPCFPYAGPEVGFFAVPPIGAAVWIEFEGGNPTYPIWSGCYWENPLDVPPLALAGIPFVKGMITDFVTMLWDDTPEVGGFLLTITEPVAPSITTITCNVTGIEVTVPPAVFSMTPEETSLEMPPTTILVTEALVSVDLPETLIEISAAGVDVTSDEVNVVANVSVEGPVEITGNVEITGAVEITGDVEITGAVEITGDVEIAGAVEVEGAVEIAGAVSIEGAVNVVGALAVEGDANVAGALTVEGDEAVAGVIEGVIVPPF
jgi:cytoskeletal protein CcmA (bactofilin family)